MRCPKRMLNGPCGGYNDESCEDPNLKCAWIIAFKNLRNYKREREMFKLKLDSYFKIRDHKPSHRSLSEHYRSRGYKYLLIYEYVPMRDLNIDKFKEDLHKIFRVYNAIDFVDNPGGRPLLNPLALASLAKILFPEKHVGFQITGRDASRDMITTYIVTALSLGIDSIIATTGDLKLKTSTPSVWDLDSPRIIYLAKLINDLGRDYLGRRVYTGSNKLFVGAAVNPYLEPLEPEIYKISVKRDAGADFLVTQPIYTASIIDRFINMLKELRPSGLENLDLVIGVGSINDLEIARFLTERSRVKIPSKIIEALKSGDRERIIEANNDLVREMIRAIETRTDDNDYLFYVSSFGDIDVGISIGEIIREELESM
ncbi:MAG: methylenetetrahydrofolate reductase C-terminal domain-containing protein [Sulfolobales archaeon]